jgi:hypothetical protein
MHDSDNFVAVIAILVIFGMPLALAMANRWYAHQERLEMIRRGIAPPPDSRWARRAMRHGWFQAPPAGGVSPDYYAYMQYQAQRQLRGGITLICVGIGLTIGLSFVRPGEPGPWLLGGLIPMFVGVAQVVTAMLSGAGGGTNVLGGSWQQPGAPPPGQQQAPAGAPFSQRDVTAGGYGAWRPGPTTGLEKPPSPPEAR